MATDTLSGRSASRRARMKHNRARNFDEAKLWDLEFWQGLSPAQRLVALESIRREWKELGIVRDR